MPRKLPWDPTASAARIDVPSIGGQRQEPSPGGARKVILDAQSRVFENTIMIDRHFKHVVAIQRTTEARDVFIRNLGPDSAMKFTIRPYRSTSLGGKARQEK